MSYGIYYLPPQPQMTAKIPHQTLSQAVTVNAACVATVAKQTTKVLSLSQADSVILLKQARKNFAALSTVNAATVAKQITKTVSVNSTSTPSIIKQARKTISVTLAAVATVARVIIRASLISVSTANTVSLSKRVNKPINAVMNFLKQAAAFWNFEEIAANDRLDATGHGNTLLNNNRPTQVAGQVGFACRFDGLSQYLNAGTSADLEFGDSDWTMSFWVKPTTNFNVFISKEFEFDFGSTGFGVGFPGVTVYDVSGTPICSFSYSVNFTMNTWNYVIVWRDTQAGRVYMQVNNGIAESAVCSTGAAPSSADLNVGGDGGSFFPFDIDAFGIWHRVLTPAERQALWYSGIGDQWPFWEVKLTAQVNKVITKVSAEVATITRRTAKLFSLTTTTVTTLIKQANKLHSLITKIARITGTDSFTDPDNTLLSAHTPNEGPSWTGADSNYKIISNQLTNKGTGLVHAVWPGFGTEVEFSVNVVQLCPGTAVAVSIMVRHQSAANYWELFYDVGNGWQLDKVVGGIDNFIGSPMTGTTGTIKLKATKNTIVATSPDGSTRTAFDSALNTITDVAVILRGDLTTPSIIDDAQVTVFNYSLTKQINKNFVLLSTTNVASVAAIKVILRTIATVTSTATVSLIKQAQKIISRTATGTPTIARFITHAFALVTANTATVTKQINKSFAVNSSSAVSLIKQALKALTVTLNSQTTVSRLPLHVTSLTTSTVATLTKRVNKTFSIASANTVVLTAIKVVLLTISRTATGTITLLKTVLKPFTLNSTETSTVSRQATHSASLATANVATVVKQTNKSFSRTATETPSLTKQLNKTFALIASGSISLVRLISRSTVIVGASVVSIIKRTSRSFVLTATETFTIQKQVNKPISQDVVTVATLKRDVSRNVSVIASGTVSVRSIVTKTFSVTTAIIVTLARAILRHLAGPFTIRLDNSGKRNVRLDDEGTRTVKLDNDGKRKPNLDDH